MRSTTAVGLAELGHDVVLAEQDARRLGVLTEGRIPFYEPELPGAYAHQHAAGRLTPVATIPNVGVDLVIVWVGGKPIDDSGTQDVSFVARALDQAIPAMAAGAACVIRSTLPVGSAGRLAQRPGVVSERLFVAPEFLRQGTALNDIRRPTRVIIGTVAARPIRTRWPSSREPSPTWTRRSS